MGEKDDGMERISLCWSIDCCRLCIGIRRGREREIGRNAFFIKIACRSNAIPVSALRHDSWEVGGFHRWEDFIEARQSSLLQDDKCFENIVLSNCDRDGFCVQNSPVRIIMTFDEFGYFICCYITIVYYVGRTKELSTFNVALFPKPIIFRTCK